jgi:hypothetical protein
MTVLWYKVNGTVILGYKSTKVLGYNGTREKSMAKQGIEFRGTREIR